MQSGPAWVTYARNSQTLTARLEKMRRFSGALGLLHSAALS